MSSSAEGVPCRDAGGDGDYEDSLRAVRTAIERLQASDERELHLLADDLRELTAMADKLATGQVEIAVFGEISTGKSALINALVGEQVTGVDVRGGWTKQTRQIEWDSTGYTIPGFGQSKVMLIDTPGLNEVDGAARADLARATASRADLVVFVADSDLNEVEYRALVDLAGTDKPLLLALNKADLYRPEELQSLLRVLRGPRLNGIVQPQDVVVVQADPRETEYVIESAGGRTRSEWRKPPPQVEPLRIRILELLQADGKALVALNGALFAADKSDRMAALRVQYREASAAQTVWNFAVAKSLAVALNPIGIADVAGGALVDGAMVITLGRIYGISVSTANAQSLIASIAKSAGLVTVFEIAISWASSAFKALTGGLGTVATAVPQGAAAGFGSYIVGQAARYYFQHGASWGSQGAKQVVQRILDNTDKQSVIERLKVEIRGKLASNRHIDAHLPSKE
jgi:small GTP-binding protein